MIRISKRHLAASSVAESESVVEFVVGLPWLTVAEAEEFEAEWLAGVLAFEWDEDDSLWLYGYGDDDEDVVDDGFEYREWRLVNALAECGYNEYDAYFDAPFAFEDGDDDYFGFDGFVRAFRDAYEDFEVHDAREARLRLRLRTEMDRVDVWNLSNLHKFTRQHHDWPRVDRVLDKSIHLGRVLKAVTNATV